MSHLAVNLEEGPPGGDATTGNIFKRRRAFTALSIYHVHWETEYVLFS